MASAWKLRAVFFHRLGKIRDRGFEQQRYRASGLNLLTAAIVLTPQQRGQQFLAG